MGLRNLEILSAQNFVGVLGWLVGSRPMDFSV